MTELGTSSLGVSTLGETGERFANEIRFAATFDVRSADFTATFDVDEANLDGWVVDQDLEDHA